jgi:hypothetical protein
MNTKKNDTWGCIWPGVFLLMVFTVLAMLLTSGEGRRGSPSRPSTGSQEGRISSGNSTLYYSGNSFVTMSASADVEDRLMKLSAAGDVHGVNDLMNAGLVWTVPNGTEVIVISRGIFKSEVKVQSGDFAGRYGWVSSERIRR